VIKVGDLVRTRKGNIAIVVSTSEVRAYGFVDLLYLKTRYLKTAFPMWQCEVISESR
jgi:hypothetical protein